MTNLKKIPLLFCCIFCNNALATNSITLPFKTTSRGHIVIPVTVNGAMQKPFIFDTGASTTVINNTSPLAELLAKNESTKVTVNRAHASFQAIGGVISSLTVGQFMQEDVDAVVMDLSDVEAEEFKTDGVIGFNYFGEYDITINYRTQQLTLSDKTPHQECSKLQGVEFKLNNGSHIQFPLRLGPTEIQAILDTGAPRTGINGAAAEAILPGAVEQLEKAKSAHGATTKAMPGHADPELFLGQLGIGKISAGDTILAENHPTNVVNLPVFNAFGLAQTPGAIVGSDLLTDKILSISYSCQKLDIR